MSFFFPSVFANFELDSMVYRTIKYFFSIFSISLNYFRAAHGGFFQCIVVKNSSPNVFLKKSVLRICSKFPGEHPCRNTISLKLLSNFFEITPRHGCSPVNLIPIFRTPFYKNTYRELLLSTYHKKRSFPLRLSSVNATKSQSKLRLWANLLKKSLIENFIFCAVAVF